MTRRRPGSGLSNATATAIERLVAAALRDDSDEIAVQREALANEYDRGRCGMEPSEVVSLVRAAVDQLGLEVTDAQAQPDDRLGDVRVALDGRRERWFEVKAQTKKNRFADLTQADWVRDATDLIRWLVSDDDELAGQLPEWALDELRVPDASYFQGWDRDSLWLADIALVVNRSAREEAGIRTPADLHEFLRSKYVLHLTREGIRIFGLDALVPVASSLAGERASMLFNYENRTAVAIACSCPGPPSWGRVHFTYHVAYPPLGPLGRHKMHARSLDRASPLVVVRA